MVGHFVLLLLIHFVSLTESVYFTQSCPQYCTCDLSANILTIKCTQYNSQFALPYAALNVSTATSIITTNNFLTNIPSDVCQFQLLRILDISVNSISNLTSISLNCLSANLEFFNGSHNKIINVDVNTFSSLKLLKVIDLSFNLISFLPVNLFSGSKLPNLKYLYLNNNNLYSIDVWFFYLSSLDTLDLSHNQINKFINQINYSPFNQTGLGVANARLIDLRYNNLTSFDDSILSAYFICQNYQLAYFLVLMSAVRIDQNPLSCSCSSYNLLTDVAQLNQSLLLTSRNLFKANCTAPSQYQGLSIFNFTAASTCTSYPLNNCQVTTTTLNSVSVVNPNNPELLIGNQPYQPVTTTLADGQIAGIVIGFLMAFFLLLILLYCLCPIEILACLFGIFPSFYSWCPCKSGVVTNKKYDLFIGYNNQSSEMWIKKRLLPFIEKKRPVQNYYLQYGPNNAEEEDFNDDIKEAMSNSACILLILSDKFIMHEWTNQEFKNHLRNLITRIPQNEKDKTRLICIQMNDISDEEVDDYVRHLLQLPRFISLENDEFYFWPKLDYFLHVKNSEDTEKVMPINYPSKPDVIQNQNLEFTHYHIKAPIVHVPQKNSFKSIKKNEIVTENEKQTDVKRQASIKNKQRIKVAKNLLDLKSDDPNDPLQELRSDSPTDYAQHIIHNRTTSKIVLGKINKLKTSDTKIKIDENIEYNVVNKEAENVQYNPLDGIDYSANVKKSKLKSLKAKIDKEQNKVSANDATLSIMPRLKNVRFNKEIEESSSIQFLKKNDYEEDYDDYEKQLNEMVNTAESNLEAEKKEKLIERSPIIKQSLESNYPMNQQKDEKEYYSLFD